MTNSRTPGCERICGVGMTHAAEDVAAGLDELTAIRCMALCRKPAFMMAPEVQQTFQQLRRILKDYVSRSSIDPPSSLSQ